MIWEDQPAGGPPDETPGESGSAGADEVKPVEPSLPKQLEEALREKAQFRAIAQRAQADLVNYKHRASEERDEVAMRANSQLLLKLLSIVDDLERAISHVPRNAATAGWIEGVKLVQRNLLNTMEATGVTKIEALGKPFDPFESEALQYQETPDAEEGSVISVVRGGYKLRDKVLRAAQVVVAKKLQEPADQTQQTETTEEEATDAESTGN